MDKHRDISRPFSRRQFLPLKQTPIPATQGGFSPVSLSRRQFLPLSRRQFLPLSRRQFLPLKEGFPKFPYLAVFFFSRPTSYNLSQCDTLHSHRKSLSTRRGKVLTKGRVVLHSDSAYRPTIRRFLLTRSGDGTDPVGLRSTNKNFPYRKRRRRSSIFFGGVV